MKKVFYLISTLFCLFSCKSPNTNVKDEQNMAKNMTLLTVDSIVQPKFRKINRDSINDFLNSPFDLAKFKRAKRVSHSNGGIKRDYYKKPNRKGFYYHFFMFDRLKGYLGTNRKRIIKDEQGISIIVLKEFGGNKYNYTDPTEELIQITTKFNDFNLPELAYVGIDSVTVTKQFGEPDKYITNCLVYQHMNKVLLFNIERKRVKWLKYTRLRDNVDLEDEKELFKDR